MKIIIASVFAILFVGCTNPNKARMDALEARHELAIERIIKLEERKCVEMLPRGYTLEISTRQYIDPRSIIPYLDRQLHSQTTEYNLPVPQ